jgi:hypothetical protein
VAQSGPMSTTAYELIFVIPEVSSPADERIGKIADSFDIVVESHGDLTLATVIVEGLDATTAGLAAAQTLHLNGLTPIRTYLDLVSRQDIADRADVSRQAVGNWVRHDRHETDPFPAPHSLVSGGVWLWADVAKWLSRRGIYTERVDHPTLADHTRLDLCLAQPIVEFRGAAATHTLVAHVERRSFGVQKSMPAFAWGAVDSNQRDYSLVS